MASSGRTKAKQLADSAGLEALARVGLVAYGVVYLLIGWLALQLAWDAGPSKSPDPSGAFRTLAEQPLGIVLLWLVGVGLVALGLWRSSEVVWGHRNLEGVARVRKRVHSGVWAVIYTGLGVRSALVAAGVGVGNSHSPQKATIGVLAWPGGRAIVVAAGLIVISVGLVEAIRGARKSFSEELDTSSLSSAAHRGVLHLGQVGYITKGMALGLVGGLLSYAAWTFDWQKASGLDGALQTLLAQPFGKWLLSAMAFGFVAFGLFAILQFRYRRM
jgi:hypothetical protein